MEERYHRRRFNQWACQGGNMMFLALLIVVSYGSLAFGGRTIIGEHTPHSKLRNKSTIKTFKNEDGDIIDCVDIHKQPALSHPSLQNHTIQMRPTALADDERRVPSASIIHQMLLKKSGSCPDGTVPIRRTKEEELLLARTFKRYQKRKEMSSAYSTDGHESAVLVTKSASNGFYGAKAQINVWNLQVEPNEFSASKMTILGDDAPPGASSIQAGWLVHPQLFGDTKTRLFTYWIGNSLGETGCFNIMCPGFVQVSKEIFLGSVISPLSTYGGHQSEIELLVYKDPTYKNWWLLFGTTPVGYWPETIFGKFESASVVEWGGEVLNLGVGGHHTVTQMGNGHYPSEGFQKASFFRNILVVDASMKYREPKIVGIAAQRPDCYNISYEGQRADEEQGYFFYYGGFGYGPTCL